MPLSRRILAVFWVALATSAMAQTGETAPPQKSPLIVLPATPPPAVQHAAYYFEIRTRGGTPPLKFKVVKGTLPPGLELDPEIGVITGQPGEAGNFDFTVEVSDSSQPPQRAEQEFTVHSATALAVEWVTPPRVTGDTISGAVELTNGTRDDFDLTLIVVAVNGLGKAFALGYQHFTLSRETNNMRIDFSSNVPAGAYIVHVDAVAEVAKRDAIFRARLQTPAPLNVPLIE